jgi:hypothetical protein
MTIEKAIHDQWSASRSLAGLVPPERLYTGLPPIRDATGNAVTFPYVSLGAASDAELTRTSSATTLGTERIRFSIYTKSYDEGRDIDQSICDWFNRRSFAWARGRVLDMRPGDRAESEDPQDGVWRITRDFEVRYSDTSGSRLT